MPKHLWAPAFLACSLAACGGGGDAPGGPDADPSGIWSGTFTEAGATYSMVALVDDHHLMAVSTDAGILYEGRISPAGSDVSGSFKVYEDGGGFVGNTAYAGTVKEGESIEGRTGDGVSFSLGYEPLYDRRVSLATAAGIWSQTDGAYTITLTLQESGSLSGGDTEGCQYSGTVAQPDRAHNLFKVLLTVANCSTAENGTYTGYGVLNDGSETNDLLDFALSSANYIAVGELVRH